MTKFIRQMEFLVEICFVSLFFFVLRCKIPMSKNLPIGHLRTTWEGSTTLLTLSHGLTSDLLFPAADQPLQVLVWSQYERVDY